ncbi:WUS-interacting protein 2 [Salvia divinorum]|uniref:WUS-interacting protein 2 n=1 Tax=Salvia divinorum TaxID=28513 RepID=A0ABD1I9J8_SALDI
MSSRSQEAREIVFLVLQFLDEERCKETAHKLEQESGLFFNMRYIEEAVTNGEWENLDKYVSAFTKVEDNAISMKIIFEIRKQKYFQALDNHDHAMAVETLQKDLKIFSQFNVDVFNKLAMLLSLKNFRASLCTMENDERLHYADTMSARATMLADLKKLILANPLFRDKLHFPPLTNSSLRNLIKQGLILQHYKCKYPERIPDINALFVGGQPIGVTNPPMGPNQVVGFPQIGGSAPIGARAPPLVTNPPRDPNQVVGFPQTGGSAPIGARAPPLVTNPPRDPNQVVGFPQTGGSAPIDARAPPLVTNPPMGPNQVVGFPQIGGSASFQFAPEPSFAEWMVHPSSAQHQAITMGSRPPNNAADSAHVLKRSRTFGVPVEASSSRPSGVPVEANKVPVKILPVACPGQSQAHSMYTADDLPKNVVGCLDQGSAVKSMDFHPVQQTLLLVGTNLGEVSIWEVSTSGRIIVKKFKVWDIKACSVTLQASLAAEYTASVNRVMWSSDGSLFGVAYSKHIVHLYAYYGGDDLIQHLEIDAHVGSVSDLAFSHPNRQFCVVTCGEDKTIKVWDAKKGVMQYRFEGHEAPVYSICTHQRRDCQFIISTAVDGKAKLWLYDTVRSIADFDVPGRSCTTMAYSADGIRLFSCGTNKDGESHIVEWNEDCGALKRTYVGLGKRSQGMVQFDTTRNHFLAAGDEFKIKFWEMENVNVLMSIDADGGLPASPCIRFCKEGVLLAVSTSNDGVKILANVEGIRLMRSVEKRAGTTSKVQAPVIGTLGASGSAAGRAAGVDKSYPMAPVTGTLGASGSAAGPTVGVDRSYQDAPVIGTLGASGSAVGPTVGVDRSYPMENGKWEMENVNVLMSIDADGGLPVQAPVIGTLGASGSAAGVDRSYSMAPVTGTHGASGSAAGPTVGVDRSYQDAPVIGTLGASGSAAGSTVGVDRSFPMDPVIGPNNGDTWKLPDAKPRISELDKSKMWKLTEINEQAQLRSLMLPDKMLPVRILRLTYTNSGSSILTLAYNAVHKLWKWEKSERNVSGKASTSVPPQLWQPSSGILMTNNLGGTDLQKAVPCFALSKNDGYVMSTSGGRISLFNMLTFKTITTFMPPPPAVTSLAFHPQDNNVVAIGMEDSSIQIYNVKLTQLKTKLKGHQKRVTGLAFSSVLGVLVSSAADAELRVWVLDGWEKQTSKFLQKPGGGVLRSRGQTHVKFHQDQTHVLVVHKTCIAVYEGSRLDYVNQWIARKEPITDATYSCDSQSIFTCFEDGSVGIFTAAGLKLRCRINPAAYLPPESSLRVHPLAITGHPSEANQFALGMSDGGVHVLEPLESEGQWGTSPDQDTSVGQSKVYNV